MTFSAAPTPPALPVVLIPGFMCDASLWRFIDKDLGQLAELHYASLEQGDSIESMAAAIIRDLPERCILIGFSLGGYVARHIAAQLPQRIDKLVLLNTSARATTPDEIARHQQQIRMLEVFPYKGQTMTALKRALHPARSDQQALLDDLQNVSLRLGREVFMRQLSVIRADGHAELAGITCPTLIIASRQDQMRSLTEAEQMQSALPHAQLVIMEDCGHMSPLEQPARLLQLLTAFITQHER